MSDDLPLDLEKVKFLLPPYLLNELFGESLTSEDSQNQPTNDILINGEEEVIVRVASFDNQQSNQLVPIYQVLICFFHLLLTQLLSSFNIQ